MNEPKVLLGPMRLPFLLLPPACVLLGIDASCQSNELTGRAHYNAIDAVD